MRDLGVATRRRAIALIAAAVAPLADRAAYAEYGEGANMAPPALIPSPFRPTGKMAETCEVSPSLRGRPSASRH